METLQAFTVFLNKNHAGPQRVNHHQHDRQCPGDRERRAGRITLSNNLHNRRPRSVAGQAQVEKHDVAQL